MDAKGVILALVLLVLAAGNAVGWFHSVALVREAREAEAHARAAQAAQLAAEHEQAALAQRLAEAQADAEKLRGRTAELEEVLRTRSQLPEWETYTDPVLRELVAQHALRIRQAVEARWQAPPSTPRDRACVLAIKLGPGGAVAEVVVAKSSGEALFDASAVTAVKKASPLPLPADPAVAERFRQFRFEFRPE